MDIREEWLYLERLMSSRPRSNTTTLEGASFIDEVVEAILEHPLCTSKQLHRLAQSKL